MDSLPASARIDTTKLARAFDATTQSYKFLFFRAVIAALAEGQQQIGFDRILAGMIEAAWWPVQRYRLTAWVGRDALRPLVESIGDDLDERLGAAQIRKKCIDAIETERRRGVLRFVPQRFLQPWLEDVYKNVGDSRFDAFVQRHSAELRASHAIPYWFADEDHIEIGAEWSAYLSQNIAFITAWADLKWLAWLQKRNPNAIVSEAKLGPPDRRDSLKLQTDFLRDVLKREPEPRCILTGNPLDPNKISLDHFLPWSFVAHDRIWNLTPMSKSTNSSKGARLPRPDTLERLAQFHAKAISFGRLSGVKTWTKFEEEYATDLRMSADDLENPLLLSNAYKGVVLPMMALAERMGFPPGWPPA